MQVKDIDDDKVDYIIHLNLNHGQQGALKVAELRNLLGKAGIGIPSKANKADLVGLVLSNQAALDMYAQTYDKSKVEKSSGNASAKPVTTNPPPAPDSQAASPTATSTTAASQPGSQETPQPTSTPTPTTQPETSALPLDPEEEKKKQRAARFGIPYVPPPTANADTKKPAKNVEDGEKLSARALRFGLTTTNGNSKKRSAPEEVVDPEEAERRRKRQERFGTGNTT